MRVLAHVASLLVFLGRRAVPLASLVQSGLEGPVDLLLVVVEFRAVVPYATEAGSSGKKPSTLRFLWIVLRLIPVTLTISVAPCLSGVYSVK